MSHSFFGHSDYTPLCNFLRWLFWYSCCFHLFEFVEPLSSFVHVFFEFFHRFLVVFHSWLTKSESCLTYIFRLYCPMILINDIKRFYMCSFPAVMSNLAYGSFFVLYWSHFQCDSCWRQLFIWKFVAQTDSKDFRGCPFVPHKVCAVCKSVCLTATTTLEDYTCS